MTSPAGSISRALRPRFADLGVVMAGALLLALASWAQVPMTPVPMTLQTLAVFTIAGLAGPRRSFEIVAVWLLAAAIDLPVLAGGKSGISALTGPTAGFLFAMLVAAPVVAWCAARPIAWSRLVLLMLAAHAAVLAIGWAWLATRVGPAKAWAGGVQPFLIGAALKSLAAALIVLLAKARVSRASVRP